MRVSGGSTSIEPNARRHTPPGDHQCAARAIVLRHRLRGGGGRPKIGMAGCRTDGCASPPLYHPPRVGKPLSRPLAPARLGSSHMDHKAWVGERRTARIAGSSPARVPISSAAARPPAQASAGITVAQPLAWAYVAVAAAPWPLLAKIVRAVWQRARLQVCYTGTVVARHTPCDRARYGHETPCRSGRCHRRMIGLLIAAAWPFGCRTSTLTNNDSSAPVSHSTLMPPSGTAVLWTVPRSV
jgi:hypothetical protein